MMQPTFVIAEAGVNHNGDLTRAMKLVEVAAQAGANAVKFQTFSADAIVEVGTPTADYQKNMTGETDQHALLKKLEFSTDEWKQIAACCDTHGIEFMSTAFDIDSMKLLIDLGIKRIKVPSGEVTNHAFLRELAATGLPVILSTGMADLEEVIAAAQVIEDVQSTVLANTPRAERLSVLQCTSAYPTPVEDANLSAMHTIADALNIPVGFSDHTIGILLSPLAVGMGASIIEKHFTLDRTLPGPDHSASLEPDELVNMVANIRTAELALGDGVKTPRPAEIQTRELARRGLKAARDLPEGHVLTLEDIAVRRPETGLRPSFLEGLINTRLAAPMRAGQPINSTDLAR